jgi:hypothetical protein
VRALVATLVLPLVLLFGACGEPSVGGSGRLYPPAAGAPGLTTIRVEGTPYEMGWWHGRLLRDRIGALHRAWQAETFGDDAGLRRQCVALLPEVRARIPERVRLEWEGIAAGSGVAADDLLLTEVMRDLLRFVPGSPGLLEGAFVAEADHARVVFGGRWARLLDAEWVLVDRRPGDGTPPTVSVAWPGSLGAVAGARGTSLAFLAAEVPLDPGRDGLNGVPFGVSARLALEKARTPEEFLAACSRTTGHRALALDLAAGRRVEAVLALTGEDPVDVTGKDWRGGPGLATGKAPEPPGAEVGFRGGGGVWLLTFQAAGSPTAASIPLTP